MPIRSASPRDQARTEKLEADLLRFQQSNLELRDRLALTRSASARRRARSTTLRRRYAEDVPQGEVAELLARIQRAAARRASRYERLAFLIDAAAAAGILRGAPVTKRFMPRTPVSAGPVSYVRFDERITVTGTGESARNDGGPARGLVRPGAAGAARIPHARRRGGERRGRRAVDLRMVVDRQEYRFSVVAGERQFVEITAQACALPGASGHGRRRSPTRPVPTKPAPQDAAPLGTAPPAFVPEAAGRAAARRRPRSPSAIW